MSMAWPPSAPACDPERDLTAMQRAMWTLSHYPGKASLLNCSNYVFFTGKLDVSVLSEAVARVIARHDSLATYFPLERGRPRRAPFSARVPNLEVVEIGGNTGPALAQARAILDADYNTGFDLAARPPLSLKLCRLTSTSAVLAITVHHVVFDATSADVLFDEICASYASLLRGEETAMPAAPAYSSYVAWADASATPERVDYWERKLEGVRRLELPIERITSPGKRVSPTVVSVPLDEEFFSRLSLFSTEHNVTRFMVWLAGISVFLARWTGSLDQLHCFVSGRRLSPKFRRMVGCLVDVVPHRAAFSGGTTCRELLDQTRATLLENIVQAVPLPVIARHIEGARDVPVMVDAVPFQPRRGVRSAPALACDELAAAVAPDAFSRTEGRAISENLFALRVCRHVRSSAADLAFFLLGDRILLESDRASLDADVARRVLGGLVDTVQEIVRDPHQQLEALGRWVP